MPKVKVNDITINYEQQGTAELKGHVGQSARSSRVVAGAGAFGRSKVYEGLFGG